MVRRCLLALLFLVVCSQAVGIEPAPKAQPAVSDITSQSNLLQRLPGPANRNELLPPDEAFKMSIVAADPQTIVARFDLADGYYLYRDKFAFRVLEPADVKVTSIELPRGEIKDDPFFGKAEIFHNRVEALVHLQRASAVTIVLIVEIQGCNDRIGVCYPPIEKRLHVDLPES